jgi:hypothetical protein
VRTPGSASEPPRGLRGAGSARQARDGPCAAKAMVPATRIAPAPASATPVDQTAPASSTSGGPAMKVSSLAVASAA